MRTSLLSSAKMSFKTPHRPVLRTPEPLRAVPALAANFPPSTARPSSLFTFSAVTPASTATVRRILEENDHRYDMWEKKRRFAHNHFSHSALTRYALGATPALLQDDWEYERSFLAPLDPHEDASREHDCDGVPTITADNYRDPAWFGKKGVYSKYITFFHAEVTRLGREEAVKTYIFSDEANKGDKNKMIQCLFAGVVHPFIHIGFGLEFDDDLVLAEGLAQACLHDTRNSSGLLPSDWPSTRLPAPSKPSLPLIGLYKEFLADPALDPGPYNANELIVDRMRKALTPPKVQAMHELAARWDIGNVSDADVASACEEVAWVVTLLTGATSRPGYDVRIDFFLMHLLTSSLFLPTYLAKLPDPDNRRVLLQTYLLTLFHICLIRGRPALFLDEVMGYTEFPHGPAPRPQAEPGMSIGHGVVDEDNPWLTVVANALVANDSHVPKSIRSLLHYANKYGHTPAGGLPGAKTTNLPGLENVDGTLFVRVAGSLMSYMGWVAEGDKEGDFDRTALGWDGAWELKV